MPFIYNFCCFFYFRPYLIHVFFFIFQKLLARYVSLIPHISDAVVFPGLCDIWSTCDVSICVEFDLGKLFLLSIQVHYGKNTSF